VPVNTLLPHRLTGHEEINGEFHYELEALSSDANIELKTLLGESAQIEILTDLGTTRAITGLVTGAEQLGSDGGFATYKLIIESALAPLALRRTWRVFLGLSSLDVAKQILQEHRDANAVLAACLEVDVRVQTPPPAREFIMQAGESDAAFLRRLLALEGLSTVIEPSVNRSVHTLVIFEDSLDLDQNEAGSVRFHRADATEASDTITQWSGHRTLQASAVARGAWDHGSGGVSQSSEQTFVNQGQGNGLASTLEDYHYQGGLEGQDPDAFSALTRKRMQAREGWTKRFEGVGTVRAFRAGTWFTLEEHPGHDQDNNFVIARLEVEAENNLLKDVQEGILARLVKPKHSEDSTVSPPPYRCRFTCVRRGTPVLPDEIAPPDPGLLTATVVGPGGEEIHTDELGRLKVRFLFTRASEHAEAGATNTDKDSAWIRLMQPWASAGMGGTFLPRAGDEVIVNFLGRDPDKPVILGVLPGGMRKPASFSQTSNLPGDKAISGLRSQMLKGSGGNELLFDDTTNELRARLASDHAKSELNLGHIVSPRSGGVADPRGSGFELKTAAYGAVRGEKGLLITSEGGAAALDAGALTSQMESGQELSKALSEVSEKHQAEKLSTLEPGKKLKESLEKTQDVNGTKLPAFGDPLLALSSPAGIVTATPASHITTAGENIHVDSGGDTVLAVGKKLVMAITEAWSVFVAKSGIKLFAGKANIDIQAHEGQIGIIADQNVKVISTKAGVELLAKTSIHLAADGTGIELKGGNLNITLPGTLQIKAGNIKFLKGEKVETELPKLPREGEFYDQHFQLVDEKTGEPLANVRYEMTTESGAKMIGVTNEKGLTRKVSSGTQERVKIEINVEDEPQ